MSGDKVKLTLEEAVLCRQWFDAVQDPLVTITV